MSYRDEESTLLARLEEMERRLRRVEQPGSRPPSRDWVLVEVAADGGGATLHWKNATTGTLGPAIGTAV